MEGGRIIDEDNKSALEWCRVCGREAVDLESSGGLDHVTQVTRTVTAFSFFSLVINVSFLV